MNISKVTDFSVKIMRLAVVLNMVACADVKQSDYVNVDLVKQGIKDNKIRRFKEEQVLQAAYFRGEQIRLAIPLSIYQQLSCESSVSSMLLPDSLTKLTKSIVLYCQFPTTQPEKVQILWEAYRNSTIQKQTNIPTVIQKIGQDSLLYPVYIPQKEYPDGFAMLAIWLSRKEIIKTLY